MKRLVQGGLEKAKGVGTQKKGTTWAEKNLRDCRKIQLYLDKILRKAARISARTTSLKALGLQETVRKLREEYETLPAIVQNLPVPPRKRLQPTLAVPFKIDFEARRRERDDLRKEAAETEAVLMKDPFRDQTVRGQLDDIFSILEDEDKKKLEGK